MRDKLILIFLFVFVLLLYLLQEKSSEIVKLKRVELEYQIFRFADSLEGINLSFLNLPDNKNTIIFIVNPKSCVTCLIIALRSLVNKHAVLIENFEVLLIGHDLNSTLLGFIEKNGYDKYFKHIDLKVNLKLPNEVSALCLLVKGNKIIYSFPLIASYLNYLEFFYIKIERYLLKENF